MKWDIIEASKETRADSYADFWREAINKTNKPAWHCLFNSQLWGGVRHLSKSDLLEAESIADKLADDSLRLWNSVTLNRPDPKDIPTLIAGIRTDWERAGIPEEIRNHEDLLQYFNGNVFPLFQDDAEAITVAKNIGSAIDYRIMFYLRETLCYLRKLAGIPGYIFINTPKTTAQLKRIYNGLAAAGYVARDTWPAFFRCFDSMATQPGQIMWKRMGKNRHPNKRAMCDFLSLFGVERNQWAEYVRALFNESISPAAISNAGGSSCYGELKAIIEK